MNEKWITMSKGFGIVFVVLGHAISGVGVGESRTIWTTIYYLIGLFHMPLFFMASGYLFSVTSSKHSYWDSVKRKSISFGIPYIAFNLIYALIGQILHDSKYNILNLRHIFTKPISHFWFLYVLFAVYIIYPVLVKVLKSEWILILCAIALLEMSIIKYEYFEVNKIVFYIIFFAAGVLFHKYKIKEKLRNNYVFLAGGFVAFIFAFICMNSAGMNYIFLKVIAGIGGTIVCWFFALEIEDKNKLLYTLGEYSMPIYLYHSLVLSITRKVVSYMGIMNIPIIIIVSAISGITVSYLVYLWAKRVKLFDWLIYPLRYQNKR